MAIEDAIFRRTELLKERMLSINPQAHITAIFGFMLAGWLSEIYYRPAVIVPYYLTGYEHAVVAACLVIAMHENVILAVKGYHSAMSYTDVTVIALGYYSAASVCYGFAVLIIFAVAKCYDRIVNRSVFG